MRLRVLVSAVCVAAAAACSEDVPPAPNAVPALASVTASPVPAEPGSAVVVTAVAADLDGDPLAFAWTVPDGWAPVGATDKPSLALTAPPDFSASALVRVQVSDSRGGSVSGQALVSTRANGGPSLTALVATPNPVAPGGKATLVASVDSPFPVSFSWSSSSPDWSVEGSSSGHATLSAPKLYDSATLISVVADDGKGGKASARLVVSTLPFSSPLIDSVEATPSEVAPGGVIRLLAAANSPSGLDLSYSWSVAGSGWTLTGNGPTASLSAPAEPGLTTAVTLEVKDSAGASALSTLPVSTSPDRSPDLSLSAAPNPVVPGGTVNLLALAQGSQERNISFSWSVADSSWSLQGSGAQASLKAPSSYASSTAVTVKADDGVNSPSEATLVVSTVDYASPVIEELRASPSLVAPGGSIELDAAAVSPNGLPLLFSWAVSDSSWTLTPSGDKASLAAPSSGGKSTSVRLTVTDSAGGSAQRSLAVATTPDQRPVITLVHVDPYQPVVGSLVKLTAEASIPSPSWSWRLSSAPDGSSASLSGAALASASLTPDKPGTYRFEVVASGPGGSSLPAAVAFSAQFPPPSASIAGSSPLLGAPRALVELDGSRSRSGSGAALLFDWQVLAAPDDADFGFQPSSSSARPKLFGDRPGDYLVQLTVVDSQTWLSSFATATVRLGKPSRLEVVSGSAQSAKAGSDLSAPIVFKALTDDGLPMPHAPLRWSVSNGLLPGGAPSETDADGLARVLVRGAKLAGSGKLSASLAATSVKAEASFSVVAADPAAISLSGAIGSVDDGLLVTVQIADQFGNKASSSSAASAPFTLYVSSPSGQARFAPESGSPTDSLEAQLTGGSFQVKLVDPVAEVVSLYVGPRGGTPPLPFSGWFVEFADGAEHSFDNTWFRYRNSSPRWDPASGSAKVASGARSLGLELTPSHITVGQSFPLHSAQRFRPHGESFAKLLVTHKLSLPSAFSQTDSCTSQPRAVVGIARSLGEYPELAFPLRGYPVADSCVGGGSSRHSLASTDGFVTDTFDLGPTLQSRPGGFLTFRLDNPARTDQPLEPAHWYLDEVQLWRAYPASLAGASANAVFRPGKPVRVAFSDDGPVAWNSSWGHEDGFVFAARLLDQHGNRTFDSDKVFRVRWSPSASVRSVVHGESAGVGNDVLDLRFEAGLGALHLDAPSTGSLSFTLENPKSYSGVELDPPQSRGFFTWQSHRSYHPAWGTTYWSDGVPRYSRMDERQAMRACEATRFGYGYSPTNPNGTPCTASLVLPGMTLRDYPGGNFDIGYSFLPATLPFGSGQCRLATPDNVCAAPVERCPQVRTSGPRGYVFRPEWNWGCNWGNQCGCGDWSWGYGSTWTYWY